MVHSCYLRILPEFLLQSNQALEIRTAMFTNKFFSLIKVIQSSYAFDNIR